MTASRIGLAVLTAIAVVLGVVHLVVGTRAAATSRAIFAERVATATTALTWQRAGVPTTTLARTGDAWTMTAPSPGPVDPAAVADVLGALRGARWQRDVATAP